VLVSFMLCAASLSADDAPAKAAAAPKPSSKTIQSKLGARTEISADKTPLKDIVKTLSEQHEVSIRLDEAGLKRAGVSPDLPITVEIKRFTLNAALLKILDGHGLFYRVDEGGIVISDARAEPVAVEAPAAQPRPADRVVIVDAGANLAELQFLEQYRPLLRTELEFVKKICLPTNEQQLLIAQEGERILKDAAKRPNDVVRGVLMLGVRARAAPSNPADLRKQLQEGLAASVKSHLSEVQAALYRDEIEKRAAHRRQIAVRNIVARLDQELALSAAQREKLCESLVSNWNDAWCASLEVFLYGNEFLPQIPDQFVAPALSDAQKKLWRAMLKSSGVVFGGNVNVLGIPWDDEPLGGVPADAAKGVIRE
jgi:hypothetical protein